MTGIIFSDLLNEYEIVRDFNDTTTNGYRDCEPYYPIIR